MRAGLAAGQDRRLGGLDGYDLHLGFTLLEHLSDAGDRAAGTDTGHEDVDLAVGVGPDFLGGGAAMHGGVGRVGELTGQNAATLLGDLLGFRDGPFHAQRTGCQHHLGAVGAQQGPAL